MTRRTVGHTNFNAGQLSPRLWSRIDVTKYDNGLETATNIQVTGHGPFRRRNGFKMIAPVKTSSLTVGLLKFQFANDDSFTLEFGNQYIRFFQNDSPVLNTGTAITGVTLANPGVVTSVAHGLVNGDQVYITGVVGTNQLNDRVTPFVVANKTNDTFELTDYDGNNVNTSSYSSYVSDGTVQKVYEITSPYATADIPNISYVQFGDVVYLTHPDYAVRTLTRNSSTNWVLTTLEYSPPPTYEAGERPATTLTPAATSGTGVNFTAGAATFVQADVGRQIINNSSGETGKAIIVSITSSTVAVADIITAFTDTNAIASQDWELDLSPIAELNFSGTASGSIVTVTSKYPTGFKGTKVNISGATVASPVVVTTSSSHGFATGESVYMDGVVGMSQLNGRTVDIVAASSTTFNCKEENTGTDLNGIGFTTYASGGTAQKVFTGVAADCFRTTDVGKFIIANNGVLKIIERVSAQEVKCEVLKSLNASTSTNNWTLETETWSSTRGYPRAIGMYQQRLVFAGTDAVPQGVWFSEAGIFNGFGRGTGDGDSISIELSSRQINQINWLANSQDLIVGTAGSELTIDAPSSTTGLSASNIRQLPRTVYGSELQTPISIGSEIIYVQNSGRKVRAMRYDFNIDGYIGEDLTYLAEDMTSGIIKQIAYAQEPDNIIYVVTEDGNLLSGTYKKDQDVIGWSKFTTDGTFENVQTISEDNRDKVYVVVKRTINGNTKRYIEVLDNSDGSSNIDGYSDSYSTVSNPKTITSITKANPAVVSITDHGFSNGDRVKFIGLEGMTELNGKTYLVSSATTNTFSLQTVQSSNVNSTSYGTYTSGTGNCYKLFNTISNLDHLEGESVEIKVDGGVVPNATVTNGSITLSNYAYEATVGLGYTSTAKFLRKSFQLNEGEMQGQRVRYVTPILRVHKSAIPLMNGELSPSRESTDDMDTAVPLFTGDIYYGNLDWSDGAQITITLDKPLPLMVTGLFGVLEGNVK